MAKIDSVMTAPVNTEAMENATLTAGGKTNMSFKDSKVVIVGLGNVGATTAYSIINQRSEGTRLNSSH